MFDFKNQTKATIPEHIKQAIVATEEK
jgi:hypothetical protein